MTTLLEAFEASLKNNTHISDIDEATVEAGRKIATAIDAITDPATGATPTEVTKALYLTPHLISIQKELLATPLSRKQVGVQVSESKKASRLSLIQDAARKAVESS